MDAAAHFGCEAVGIDLFDDRLSLAVELATTRGERFQAPLPVRYATHTLECVFLRGEGSGIAPSGVSERTSFMQADAREFDFSAFDVQAPLPVHTVYARRILRAGARVPQVVCVFLLPAALKLLLPKLKESIGRGARVASYWFPIDGLSGEICSPDARSCTTSAVLLCLPSSSSSFWVAQLTGWHVPALQSSVQASGLMLTDSRATCTQLYSSSQTRPSLSGPPNSACCQLIRVRKLQSLTKAKYEPPAHLCRQLETGLWQSVTH